MTPELQHRVNEANEKDRHLTQQGRQDVETINTLSIAIQDGEEVLADKRRLTREIDVALNGNKAAEQAGLCDILSQIKGDGISVARIEQQAATIERMRAALNNTVMFDPERNTIGGCCTVALRALPGHQTTRSGIGADEAFNIECDHDYEVDRSKGYPGEWMYGPCKKCGQPRP